MDSSKSAGNAIYRSALIPTAHLRAVDILASAEDHIFLPIDNADVAMNINGRQVSCTAAVTPCLSCDRETEDKLLCQQVSIRL